MTHYTILTRDALYTTTEQTLSLFYRVYFNKIMCVNSRAFSTMVMSCFAS